MNNVTQKYNLNCPEDKDLYDNITRIIVSHKEEDRVMMSVEINQWKWPTQLAKYKPENWDSLQIPEQYNNKIFSIVSDILHLTTNEYDRSRTWWLTVLQRTQQEHLNWWLGTRFEYAGYLESESNEN